VRFKSKVVALPARNAEVSQAFYEKAEQMLAPTFKLAAQLSNAYEQLREQLSHLLTFAECRTDALTGVANRRALDEHLTLLFGMLARNDRPFTIAIFSVDQFQEVNDEKGVAAGEKVLHDVASLFKKTVRETDFLARCGGDEFVVVMPKTRLFGGSAFGERLRSLVEQKLSLTVSGGTAEATPKDTSQTLLARADSALYSAKAAGRNVVFQHNGATIRQVEKQCGPGRSGRSSEAAANGKSGRPRKESTDASGPADSLPLEAVGSREA
jgi:diguanylate cyclase